MGLTPRHSRAWTRKDFKGFDPWFEILIPGFEILTPLVYLDQVYDGDKPLGSITGHVPLKDADHVVRHVAVVVRCAKRPVETDFS